MTGWTWDQVRDQLDMPRVEALREAWKKNPPLAISMRVAAEALGVEFTGSKLISESQSSGPPPEYNPDAIMAELGQSEVRPYVRPRMGLPLGDAAITDNPA